MNRKKDFRHHLTSERLGKRFGNMFDLVKYAKRVAEGLVHSGRTPENENIAMRILEDIAQNREKLITPEQIEAQQKAMEAILRSAPPATETSDEDARETSSV